MSTTIFLLLFAGVVCYLIFRDDSGERAAAERQHEAAVKQDDAERAEAWRKEQKEEEDDHDPGDWR
jgi:hypothetical protein